MFNVYDILFLAGGKAPGKRKEKTMTDTKTTEIERLGIEAGVFAAPAGTKITVYTTSEFFGSVVKYEGKLVEYGRKKYAQYDSAPYVHFIPKGKRKTFGIIKGYKPYLLIVEGWDAPEPDSFLGEAKESGDVVVRQSRYRSFNEGYTKDFDELIAKSNVKIIADFREKGGVN